MGKGKWKGAVLIVAIAMLAMASSAHAARYASPTGSGTTCSVDSPCSIQTALISQSGEIILNPGDYYETGTGTTRITSNLMTFSQVDVHGVDGQPRPRIFASAQFGVGLYGAGSTVRHIAIDRVGSTPGVAFDFSGTLAEDMYVKDVTSANDSACRPNASATIRNTVCYGGVTSNGVLVSNCPGTCSPTLRNVTAWGRFGLSTFAGTGGTSTSVTVINTSMQGLGDIGTSQTSGGTMTVTPTYSHYRTTETSFGGTVVTSPTNQMGGNPSWTDTTTGDFHQMPDSSITIDKGITDPANGTTDFDGQPRAQGASMDIGADEFAVATGPPPGGGGGGGAGPPPGGGQQPALDAAVAIAQKGPKCLSIAGVVRDRVVKLKGGGKITLATKQLDDPAAPLRLSVKLTGGGSIKSAVFTANGKAATVTGRTASVPVTALSIGSRRNKLKVKVKLASGKTVTVQQLAIVLRCSPPAVTCKRVGDGRKLNCNSKTPLGGRRVKVTLVRSKSEKATGSAAVSKGKYAVVLTSSTPLAAGTYAYKAVVTTKRRGERFQMIRLVTVT